MKHEKCAYTFATLSFLHGVKSEVRFVQHSPFWFPHFLPRASGFDVAFVPLPWMRYFRLDHRPPKLREATEMSYTLVSAGNYLRQDQRNNVPRTICKAVKVETEYPQLTLFTRSLYFITRPFSQRLKNGQVPTMPSLLGLRQWLEANQSRITSPVNMYLWGIFFTSTRYLLKQSSCIFIAYIYS